MYPIIPSKETATIKVITKELAPGTCSSVGKSFKVIVAIPLASVLSVKKNKLDHYRNNYKGKYYSSYNHISFLAFHFTRLFFSYVELRNISQPIIG